MLDYTETLPFTEWTIYSERVNTYADGVYSEEKDSFNRPSGAETVTVYAKVENLAANVEYVVHWIAPDGTEVEKSNPTITAGQGYFGCWLTFNSSSQSGIYKIRITDPLDKYTCCENTFEIVAPAEMDTLFTLPEYVTVNQPFVGSFTFINTGGAVITNATLIPTDTVNITSTGGGAIDFTPDDTEALFSPRLSEVPGYGQATTTFKLKATHVGTVRLTTSATGFDNNSGLTLSRPNIQSNICTIQNPPDIRITNITKTANTVFKNQKNLRVTATIRNDGQATAVITAASITFNIGTYEQELMGYPDGLELELTSGQSKTITFDVSVDVESASGLDTLIINAIWYDKNWPRNMVSSGNTTWTIADCGIILSPDPDFDYEQADFVQGQTINVRAYGVAPNTQYYRIRFYRTQIAQANQVPAGYVDTDQGYSGLLAANDDGYVDHIYTLPPDATIGTWSVTLESCGTNVGTTATTRGNMLALQYFRVQNTPHMTAVITAENKSIEKDDKIFVGDTFKVTITLTSTTADNNTTPAVNTGAIDFIEPYSLIKNTGATGNVELVSGPDPATFTLRAGESKTFEYVYRATDDTTGGRFSFKSSDNTNVARGRNRNIWDHDNETPYDVFAKQQLTSNQIDIYRKSMRVEPQSIDYGIVNIYAEDYPQEGLLDGATQEFNINLIKTGNYDIENIRLNGAALNGLIGDDGLRKSISSAYFNVDVASFSNPLTLNSESTKALLNIPFNQEEGPYTSTMFLYSDANNNGVFDSGEITAEFNVFVYVNRGKVIKINDKVVSAGSWSRGKTTDNYEVNYFNAGNVDCTNAKIIVANDNINSPLTDYIHFITPSDRNIGAIPIGDVQKAVFNITIPDDAPLGTYIATYTIFEDRNGDGECRTTISPHNPEPFDTFQIRLTIGEPDFTVLPAKITASPVETSLTARSGIYPSNFAHLTIKNNSTNGMSLSRIKMIADDFDGVDKLGNHYPMASNTVDIYPGTLKQPLESGESDEFDIEVYIAPGTRCATYTTHLRFYSDDNDNNIIDPDEASSIVVFEVYVKPTEKVKVIDKPVSVTGMSSDVQETYAECEFLCYNLGNVDLKHLRFEMQNLVQKDVPTPVTIESSRATFSFVGGGDPFTAPLNSEFSAKINIRVPKDTPDGVYVTTVPCKIYNDNGGDPDNEVENLAYDEGECFDEFQVWLQIGEMKLVIINPHDIHGEPSERSSEGAFTIKNDGALTVTSVNATATSFIMGGNVIPASASVFLPSPKVGTLKPGFQKNLNWVVDIPDCMPAGIYTGKIIAWSDTDGNEDIGATEASAAADVKITVESAAKLRIRDDSVYPTDIDVLYLPTMTNNSTTETAVRLYNTGNEAITNSILFNKNDLLYMTSAITADHLSITIDSSAYPIEPGSYVIATITATLGSELLSLGHYRGNLEFYVPGGGGSIVCSDSVVLDLEFGEKNLVITPNPLIFNNPETESVLSVTATRNSNASLKHICVYEKEACNCGQLHCGDTSISMIGPQNVEITTSRTYSFEISVNEQTPPGWHVATWTFFDDSDRDGLYDEGEYYVDLLIQYYISEKPHLDITEDSNTFTIRQGYALTYTYSVTNNGNIPLILSNSNWNLPSSDLYDSETGESLPYSCFAITGGPSGELAVGDSAAYTITISIPRDQPIGTFGPTTMSISHGGIAYDNTTITINVTKSGGIPASSVYQSVATDTFEGYVIDDVATKSVYFLSAWVCPVASGTDVNYGNLSLIRYNEEERPVGALTVRIDNNGNFDKIATDSDFSLFSIEEEEEYVNIGTATSYLRFAEANGNPIFGISGDPVLANDTSTEFDNLKFYRIYFAFQIPNYDPATSSDTFKILLTQSKSPSNTASSTVFFDGVKLEKTLFEGQDRPTTYHQGTTLVSPSSSLDVSGKHKRYEW